MRTLKTFRPEFKAKVVLNVSMEKKGQAKPAGK